jgi:hypothetical protein
MRVLNNIKVRVTIIISIEMSYITYRKGQGNFSFATCQARTFSKMPK